MNTLQSANKHYLEITWEVENGRLSIQPQDGRSLAVKNISGSIEINGTVISLANANRIVSSEKRDEAGNRTCTVEFFLSKPDLCWIWDIVQHGNTLLVTTKVRNISNDDQVISNWHVLHAQEVDGEIVDMGEEPESIRFFGWRPWDMQVERFSEEAEVKWSHNICHLHDPITKTTLLAAFTSIDRMLLRHDLSYNVKHGVNEYRATCTFGKYKLSAGDELCAETLLISYVDDPYFALEHWADIINQAYRPRFDVLPIVNWGGGAWIDVFSEHEDNWENIALENARAMREKLKGFEVGYIVTSQADLKDGIPGNWLTGNQELIPSGMPAFLAKLKALGFDHKLWFSPFWFFAEAAGILEENSDNLLKDREGEVFVEPGNWEWDINGDPDDSLRLTKYYLDGTHPKTKKYVENVFSAHQKMGARAYMLDFLSIKDNAKLHDESLLPVEAARAILEVIRKAAGDATHLQTAVSSTPGFVGLINAARVGRDFGEGRPMSPYHAWYNANYVLHDDHFANLHYFIQNAAANYFTHRKVYLNDLNNLAIDKPVPIEHARIATTMFGLSAGSPMCLADDFRTIDSERLRMVKLCLPRTQDMLKPVDLFDHVFPDAYCRILKLPIKTSWDSYMVIAVFNTDKTPYATNLEFSKLGLDPDAAYCVFDFWNEEYLGTFQASFSLNVPPAACRVYRISQMRNHPWLIATDMHMQQGAVEIESLLWAEDSLTLSVTATRPVGEKGNLFFLLPRQIKLVNHKGINLLKDVRDMKVVMRLPVTFKQARESFEFQFEVMENKFVARKGWLPYATEQEWLAYINNNQELGDTRVVE